MSDLRYDKGSKKLPHEFHLTVDHTAHAFDVQRFHDTCKALGGKALDIVGIDKAGKEVQRDVMFSSVAKLTHEDAHARALGIAADLRGANYNVTRVKVETVPVCDLTAKLEIFDSISQQWKRNAPTSALPHGRYFEAHFKAAPPKHPSIASPGVKIVFSMNLMKPESERQYIGTIRSYNLGPNNFKELVSRALTSLTWAGWTVEPIEKVDIEYAIIDTNPALDEAWIGERL